MLCCGLLQLPATGLTSLILSTGNDWFTLGLGDNHDDGLTYGLHLNLGFDSKLQVQVDTLGYTDRQQCLKRYDVLHTQLAYPWSLMQGRDSITLTGSLGMILRGNLGFSEIQNFFHAMNALSPVTLDYETPQTLYHLFIGSQLNWMHAYRYISLGLETIATFAPAWEGRIQANSVAHFGDIMELKVGYQLIHGYSLFLSQVNQDQRYTGLKIFYGFDGGIFQTSWTYYPQKGISYGKLGVDVMAFFEPKQFGETDFTFSSGLRYDQHFDQIRSFAFLYKHALIEIRHKNGPLLGDLAHQNDRMTVASFFLGYQQDLLSEGFVTPYGKVLAGLQRFSLKYNFTNTYIDELLPTAGFELGLRFARSGQWQAGRQSYRPRLSASAMYVFGTDRIPYDKDFEKHTGPWLLNLGISIDVEHDLLTK